MSNHGDNARHAGGHTGEQNQDRNLKDNHATSGEDRARGDIPLNKPQQPISEERQFMPDAGEVPVPPDEDMTEEARDGFMDRYPPKGTSDSFS